MNSQTALRIKLSAIVTAVTVCVMTVLGVLVTRSIGASAQDQNIRALRNQNRLVEDLLASASEVLKLEAEKRARVFEARFPGKFTLDTRTTVVLNGQPTPELRHDGTRINGDYRQVDDFFRNTGGDVATVFARSGDDFVRVATSLTDEHGGRAVATRLAKTHPGYAKLMRGEPYLGLARLFGTYYMSKYWPIKDQSAAVIGVLFIGTRLTDAVATLKDKIRPLSGGNGEYVAIIDAAPGPSYGTFILHPAREGRNAFSEDSVAGRQVVKTILDRRQGTLAYQWMNPELGETREVEKLAVFSEFDDWQWMVVSTAFAETMLRPAKHAQRLFLASIVLTAGAIILGLNLAIGRLVIAPLARLQNGVDRTNTDLRRLNRMYKVLTACNASLVSATNETALLKAICAHLIDMGGYRLAWVGFADNDVARTVRVVAHAGRDDGYLASLNLSWAENEHGQGPTGTAIRERRPVLARNLHSDAHFAPWRSAAMQRGYAASIALPLMQDDAGCLGTLNIYAGNADAFDTDEVQLLGELADNLAHGIQALRDRAARSQAQQALQATAQQLQHLSEASPTILYSLQFAEGAASHKAVSENVARILGYSPRDALQPQWWRTHLHPQDRDAAIAANDRVLSCEHVVHEYRFAHCDGHYVWLRDELRLSRALPAGPAEAVGAWTDITERKRFEHGLERERNFLKTLIGTLPDLVWLKDPEGAFLMCNPRFERLFGHTEEDIRGKTDYDFTDRDLADFFRENDRAAIAAGGPTINEEELIFADDGHRELVETIKTPMHDSAGQLIGVLGIARDVTEKKRVEQALRESEARYRALFEHLQSGFALHEIVTDDGGKPVDHTFVAVNDAYCRMTGFDPSQIVGRRATEVYPAIAADSTDWVALFGEVVLSGHTIHLERFAEGLQRWYEITAYRPAARQFAVVMQDITERKMAAAALQESETQHRTVLAALGEGVYGMDSDGRCTFINRAAGAMLGITEAEAVGHDPHIVFHHHRPDGRPYPDEACPVYKTMRDGQVRSVEEWFFRRDGTGFPVELVATPLVESNVRGGVVVAFRDISARRQAEDTLRKLSLAVEQSPESIVITDLDANIEYVNEAFLRTSGYERGEVIGESVSMLRSGQTPDDTFRDLWATLAQGLAWKGEFFNRRKDGSEFVEFARIAPIRQPDGRVTHYVAVKEDITERKRIAAELDRHRHHLEELVEERTAQLAQARERAEVANRAKSEFLANMSHEIRTPLNGVLGLAQIGYRDSSGRQEQIAFGRILESGRLLLGIIDDILDFSKIEAGKLKIEAVPFQPDALVHNVVILMQERADAKGIALTVDRSIDLPASCLGDPLRIEQILLNLLSNAVKFTEHGGVTLRAGRYGEWLVFAVSDSGIGMNEEQIGRLFTPFEQADGSTTRRYGGTGLGLAISKRLVQLMGGKIRVESQPARGSRFEVRLPLIETSEAPAGTAAATSAAQTGPRLAGIRILVAEDADINQLVIEAFLTREGAHVVMAGDGRQALERVIEEGGDAFDIVLMDLQMPVMDGYEATRRIHEITPALPVVGQTAHVLAQERDTCLAAGMVDHLAKPIDVEDLVAVVLRHAAKRGPGVDSPKTSSLLARAEPPVEAKDERFRIDWLMLAAEFGGGPTLIRKLASALLDNHGQMPDALRQAANTHDLPALAFLTHKLKGAVGSLMVTPLYEMAKQAEEAARLEQPEATELAAALAQPLEQLLAQAREYLATCDGEAERVE